MKLHKIITSESVNIGHPDKTCDTIADAMLDEAIKEDPHSTMAVECAIKNNKLFIYGEATTKAKIDYKAIASNVLRDIGYKDKFSIITEVSTQSVDINKAVVKDDIGAGDQGMVYGYACNDTPEYMPLPIMIAHKLVKAYDSYRKGTDKYLADAKSQVSVEYVDDKPVRITTILLSVSHVDSVDNNTIHSDIRSNVVLPVVAEYSKYYTSDTQVIINPSGKFTIWGSYGDSGCVGRKIVVDTYGGVGRVGGGCFSSKDPTKVDRSGAYYARKVAKNIVAHGLADKCEVCVAYAIGLPHELNYNIECFGTNHVKMDKIYNYVRYTFDFSPSNIISELDLLHPIYRDTACYGHFGWDKYPWEKLK